MLVIDTISPCRGSGWEVSTVVPLYVATLATDVPSYEGTLSGKKNTSAVFCLI